MKYNFDAIIDRKNTHSIKYDFAEERGKPDGVLPLWVADMDFPAPPAVIEALVQKSRHGIFGYSEMKADYFKTLQTWFKQRFDWEVRPEWLVKTPGVVFAFSIAIRALTEKNDAVLIQPPVYYPFSESVLVNERRLVTNQLIYAQGKYTIDFADFEQKIIENKVKLFLLCSPHNPVGRVWRKEELIRMGEICLKHGVKVISDEIHEDFVYPGYRHFVFANLKPEFAEITATCTAPSKTFNLAGLHVSNAFIANASIRAKFSAEISRCGLSQLNIMGLIASQAAYAHGGEWLEELKRYLNGNLNFLRDFLQRKIPQIQLVEPEGTYLAWLDCNALGLNDTELDDLMENRAGLWLDTGLMFGAGGAGFQRVNIACPREVLEKALTQLEQAIKS
ncbi:MAG: MalY/PatB family protein [Clostridia bacterium]|nr:MalY/PatB family protein [Clostridia bacterium]